MNNIKSLVLVLALIVGTLFTIVSPAFAYVSVKGYYRSNGTYVKPYVRSNPNGLKTDNYGYTPSQGVYNPTYGTRGSAWDTPTTITDPDYYTGKSIYDSNNGNITYTAPSVAPTPYQAAPTSVQVPANATLGYFGSTWYCNSGYKRVYTVNNNDYCQKIEVPANASLSYLGSDWYCNYGYNRIYTTNNTDYCKQIQVPSNASLSYLGSTWYCNSGYRRVYTISSEKDYCQKIQVPANAILNYSGSDWYCNSGYKRVYTVTGSDYCALK